MPAMARKTTAPKKAVTRGRRSVATPAVEEMMEPVAEVDALVIEEAKPKTRRPRKPKQEATPVVESEESEAEEPAGDSEGE